MCGIAGLVVGPNSKDWVQQAVRTMEGALRHRGPDAGAVFVSSSERPEQVMHHSPVTVALGHRRLSIIDVEGSPQPCFNEDGSVVITFNGEIYNYRELRQTLLDAGHRFATQGDTEVLVHGWEEWGPELVHHLDGMFAFVIVDFKRQRMFGAVDPFGQKPLYYVRPGSPAFGRDDVLFAFASEPRALAIPNGVSLEPAREALIAYLLHDYVPSPQTAYRGVERLPAGHTFDLVLDSPVETSSFSIEPYWRPDPWARLFRQKQPPTGDGGAPSNGARRCDQAAEEFLELLGNAVEKRLMSDVPLGVFLSGGLDSTLLVGLLRERLGADADLETFSIGFEDVSFDESSQARATAKALGTHHHEKRFDEDELLTTLPEVAAHFDEPFADASALPFSLLCREARKHVTVVLGGDGGDELFAGYDPFRAVGVANALAHIPKIGLGLSRLFRLAPSTDNNLPLAFKVERFCRGLPYSAALRPAVWMGAFSPGGLAALCPEYSPRQLDLELGHDLWAEPDSQPASVGSWERSMMLTLGFFQRRYLPDDILVKVDRSSMMHSLEVRSPFLDRALVEWANSLPLDLLYQRSWSGLGSGKILLRRALEILAARARKPWLGLAREIVSRPKKGFGIPVRRWLRGPLSSELNRAAGATQFLLPVAQEALEKLLLDRGARGAGHPKELWALFMLGLWSESWTSKG